jgi:hypothetical protein
MASTKGSKNSPVSTDTLIDPTDGATSEADSSMPLGFFKGTVILRTPVHGMGSSVAGEARDLWSTEEYPSLRVYVLAAGVWVAWETNLMGMYHPGGGHWKVRFIPISNVAAFVPENNVAPAWLTA